MSAKSIITLTQRAWSVIGIPIMLALQNVVIFREHYFADVGFPWDFPLAYYAIVAHWTSAVSKGIFPEWIPFQQMGYPFALQLQSGLYYPPLWIFPIFKIPYTLNAAVVVQCIHVWAGAFGMFFLLRDKLVSDELAFVGAFLFQFFGGFYSNAEHVDIIRAFALAPWLLYLFTFSSSNTFILPRRILFIPLGLYLLATGAYPGNLLSTAFILAVYVIFQMLAGYLRTRNFHWIIRISIVTLILTVLGIALSAIQIGPALLYRDQFIRLDIVDALPQNVRYFIELAHLPGLFLSNKTLPGEISMTSTYVTLPALILASFVTFDRVKQHWIAMTIGGVAMLMATGPQSPFWILITNLAPWLKASRHPSSDYRVFIAIPIILLAILGLQSIIHKELSGRAIIARIGFVAIWFFTSIFTIYHQVNTSIIWALAIATATLILLLVSWAVQPKRIYLVLASLILIAALDAWRVLPDIPTWQEPAISFYYPKQGWMSREDSQLNVSSIFDSLPSSRPAREVPANDFAWHGYLDGHYLTKDSLSTLKTPHIINTNPLYFEWMLLPWKPIFLDVQVAQNENGHVDLPDEELSTKLNSLDSTQQRVLQTKYGINDVTYSVSLRESYLMIENEAYFPGWSGEIVLPDQKIPIQAIPVNGVLRGWLLPAGEYILETHFQLPVTPVFRIISLGALAIWLAILFLLGRKDKIMF